MAGILWLIAAPTNTIDPQAISGPYFAIVGGLFFITSGVRLRFHRRHSSASPSFGV